ncbi:hypothetical protein RD055328_03660 [Companilactobacillus sp. RD055328]|uniref:DUF2187 domain-containing protein n=1 Tax=Companilactobacillus sp. RD055328 TaxID=2916634 RepID=UPI001FC8B958|nr:DUF2187 domain-containing protein [Companilactobacillus sp. RD055328]GKQ42443.1 hypothetical protein RD055328_03660 [Companilactobacillus sp. RD055328]
MKIEDIKIDDFVEGKVQEDMDHPFTGKVEKIYEHSVLLEIVSNDPKDDANVAELNNKIVVNIESVKLAK